MWKFVAVLVIIIVAWIFIRRKRVEKMTDETIINTMVSKIRGKNPELVPINTVSIDGQNSRMLFVNTKTYAGEMIDSSIKEDGTIDIKRATDKIATIQEEENMEKL